MNIDADVVVEQAIAIEPDQRRIVRERASQTCESTSDPVIGQHAELLAYALGVLDFTGGDADATRQAVVKVIETDFRNVSVRYDGRSSGCGGNRVDEDPRLTPEHQASLRPPWRTL